MGQNTVEITDANFETELLQSTAPVLIDFWAPWCGPCKMVAPEMKKVAEELAGRVVVAKVNTEAVSRVAQRFEIHSIPTLALFTGGRELARQAGAMPAPSIVQFIHRAAPW